MLPQLLDSHPQYTHFSRSLLPHNSQKSNMKILVALAVFFLISTQLFAEEIGANDDLNYWSDWSDSDQIKVRTLGPQPALAVFPGLWGPHFPCESILVSLKGTATTTGGGGGTKERHFPGPARDFVPTFQVSSRGLAPSGLGNSLRGEEVLTRFHPGVTEISGPPV